MSSASSTEGSSDSGEWLDEDQGSGDEETGVAIISLVDDQVFPDAMSMLTHCKDNHNLDFLAIRDRLQLDFYGTVRLVNFIRQSVSNGVPLPQSIEASDFEAETFLKPSLEDDALLLCLDDLPQQSIPAQVSGPSPVADTCSSQVASLTEKNTALQADLDRLARQFENYRLAVQETLDRRWGDDPAGSGGAVPAAKPAVPADPTSESDGYFESYAHNDIHETMLKDTVRTDAYRDFIYNNKHLFADKVVLDIGCGTGILSMFCAKAGARQVIAVDRSRIIDKARENVFHNGLGDKITCLRGMIEEVKLPVEKVDIIVSEWMGYCLLFEAMLPSVIWARDRYLKPDGLLVPSHASLWIAPISSPEFVSEHVTFWRDVYGFDMKAMEAGICDDVRVQTLPESAVCGSPCMFWQYDLHNVRESDLSFTAKWRASPKPDAGELDGFLIWFDILFATSRAETVEPAGIAAREWAALQPGRVAFTTGPSGSETHWKQGVLLSKWHSTGNQIRGDSDLTGEISYSVPEGHARGLTLQVDWTGASDKKLVQSWSLR